MFSSKKKRCYTSCTLRKLAFLCELELSEDPSTIVLSFIMVGYFLTISVKCRVTLWVHSYSFTDLSARKRTSAFLDGLLAVALILSLGGLPVLATTCYQSLSCLWWASM